jgi:uncharacterized protein with PIN domain
VSAAGAAPGAPASVTPSDPADHARGDDPLRFLADAMLVRLARWLRAIGHDTTLAAPHEPDVAVARRAAADGRWLLTRDRVLARDAPADVRVLRLRADAPLAQLLELDAALPLGPIALRLTRCLLCNAPLATGEAGARADAVATRAVPAALTPETAVWRCTGCGRWYWEGGHTRRMRAALVRALAAHGRDGR